MTPQKQFQLLDAKKDKNEADCDTATIQVHADGSIKYSATARGTHGAQDEKNVLTLCLRNTLDTPWPDGLVLRAFDGTRAIPVDGVRADDGTAPVRTDLVYRIPDADDGIVRIDILTPDKNVVAPASRRKANDSWYAAVKAAQTDSTLTSSVGIETSCTDAQIRQFISAVASDQLKKKPSDYPLLLASLIVPTRPKTDQTITVDARAGKYATNLDVRDGATVNAWAYNVRADGSQQLSILQGGKIVQSTAVGPFLLAGLQALGSPLNVNATSLAGSSATTAGTPTSPSPTPAPTPAPPSGGTPPDCACKTGDEADCRSARDLVIAAMKRQLSVHSAMADYTAIVSFFRVTGGYSYTAAVLDSTLTSMPRSVTSAVLAPQDTAVVAISPVVGASSFKTYGSHRIASALVEEAYNWGGSFAPSGYGYVPISQTGGDQLYQLRGLDRTGDRLTLSALAVAYPLSMIRARWSRYLEGIGIAFGPTLMRGSTSELMRQWNLRAVWEIDPFHVPYLALSIGPSWRSYDVSSSSFAQVGSVVAVTKPASAPSFPTESKVDLVWSVGLSIDLAAVTDAVSAVTSAAASGAAGKTGKQ